LAELALSKMGGGGSLYASLADYSTDVDDATELNFQPLASSF